MTAEQKRVAEVEAVAKEAIALIQSYIEVGFISTGKKTKALIARALALNLATK